MGHRLKKMTYRFLIDLMGVTLIAVWAVKKIVQNFGVKRRGWQLKQGRDI